VGDASPGEKMKAIYTLKHFGGHEAIETLKAVFQTDSVLFKHEVAYVLGQTKDTSCLPFLCQLLSDKSENAIVRHEAGEAIGAIGDPSMIAFLEPFLKDPCIEVAETVELAIDRLKYFIKADDNQYSKFGSVDPAPPQEEASVELLKSKLLDTSLSLFKRYRAMFALRDRNDDASVEALAAAFADGSALLRHEIAFCFGQMSNPTAITSLEKILASNTEHEMVRHEAAEALGGLLSPTETMTTLEPFSHDDRQVVRQSCQVALEMVDYWADPNQFN
jgi:deoxyhypusine monooxygenase